MKNWQKTVNYRRIRDNKGKITAYIITVDGTDVEVSEEVYLAYTAIDRRERYYREHFLRDKVLSLDEMLMTHSKTYLAQLIRAQRINVFEIDEKLIEISTELKSRLVPDFFDYGVSLERFFVTTIVKPEEDGNYQKFKELHYRQYADVAEAKLRQQVGFIDQQTDAQRMVIESKAISQKRQQEGYTYQQERGFDVAEKVAGNEAVGQFTNMGVGLGTMAGVGGAVGGIVGGAVTGALSSETTQQLKTQPSEQPSIFCDECGASVVAGALFCDNCGKPLAFHSSPICSKCGYTFEKQSRFCPNCGTKREN